MALYVTERQTTTTWYELSGDLEAKDLFPKLLPSSGSVKEMEEEIQTEPEEKDGQYDGFPQDESEMEEEIAEFTASAISEFHDEALAAAKTLLTTLQLGQTLLHKDFVDAEEDVLKEAATTLGIALPWDPVEAAQIAAYEARRHAESIAWARKQLADAQAMVEKNATAIQFARENNKPKMLEHEQGLTQRRIQAVEDARKRLESLTADAPAEQVEQTKSA